MGIRLSPLGVAVFCLLGVGVIYHLYAGVISSRLAAFRSDLHTHTHNEHSAQPKGIKTMLILQITSYLVTDTFQARVTSYFCSSALILTVVISNNLFP